MSKFFFRRLFAAFLGVFVVVALGCSGRVVAGPGSSTSADLASGTLNLKFADAATAVDLLAKLPVAAEHRGGYQRSLFNHWVDSDGNGCSTRAEVLMRSSTKPVTANSWCTVKTGSWSSVYDGKVFTVASDVDVDHVVALAEAWDSGAWAWDANRRELFANDLSDPRHLRAVSQTSNQAKSAYDPAQWLPPLKSFWCTYVSDWISIKVRWGLSVDKAEKTALLKVLAACPRIPIVVIALPSGLSS